MHSRLFIESNNQFFVNKVNKDLLYFVLETSTTHAPTTTVGQPGTTPVPTTPGHGVTTPGATTPASGTTTTAHPVPTTSQPTTASATTAKSGKQSISSLETFILTVGKPTHSLINYS